MRNPRIKICSTRRLISKELLIGGIMLHPNPHIINTQSIIPSHKTPILPLSKTSFQATPIISAQSDPVTPPGKTRQRGARATNDNDRMRRTFHGLFNSNPGGAVGLSVCPRREPVRRRSRSITAKHPFLANLFPFATISLNPPPPFSCSYTRFKAKREEAKRANRRDILCCKKPSRQPKARYTHICPIPRLREIRARGREMKKKKKTTLSH